ncbi:hypothetical protein [Caballeronia sp. BR00000012568055]|uniref:hypothetical protein n=1 Tax=Caballeronia sp. BR00000012568055 TaxID=2918761 RepID=UPI0023F85210|nr:hypothetical protein [Caballeronia sp. BR00000012568055]
MGVSLREFARLDGCDDKLVRRGIGEGRLSTFPDGSIDPALAGTAWRKSNAQRGANPPGANRRTKAATNADTSAANADTRASVDEALRLFEQQAAAVTERVLNGASYSDALRIKENYLALLRQLEYSIKSGAVIDLAEAEQTVFDLFRGVRDAWLNWPARVAPLIAADLDFEDVERLGDVLVAHVRSQLLTLGEPDIQFRRPVSAKN